MKIEWAINCAQRLKRQSNKKTKNRLSCLGSVLDRELPPGGSHRFSQDCFLPLLHFFRTMFCANRVSNHPYAFFSPFLMANMRRLLVPSPCTSSTIPQSPGRLIAAQDGKWAQPERGIFFFPSMWASNGMEEGGTGATGRRAEEKPPYSPQQASTTRG